MGKFYCEQYPGPSHFVEKCAATFTVDTTFVRQWTRLGCFGELKFTQVYEGRVLSLRHGFYEGMRHDYADRFPAQFDITAFVYFPKGYEALDPSLDWYKCEVHE